MRGSEVGGSLTANELGRWSTPRFAGDYEGADGRYRRRGHVWARRGVAGEIVHTLEGEVRVIAGDWVVMSERGERWPVPADHFAGAYLLMRSGC